MFVCVGNICRSPTAEVLLKHKLGDVGKTVHSAGLGALVDKDLEPTAREVLLENGIEAEIHLARQLTAEMLAQADLILTMEKKHISRIGEIAPQARGKCFLLGKWLDEKEIPDPYRQQKPAFEHVYQLIDQSLNEWVKHLA